MSVKATATLNLNGAGDQVTITSNAVDVTDALHNILNPPLAMLRGGEHSSDSNCLRQFYLSLQPIAELLLGGIKFHYIAPASGSMPSQVDNIQEYMVCASTLNTKTQPKVTKITTAVHEQSMVLHAEFQPISEEELNTVGNIYKPAGITLGYADNANVLEKSKSKFNAFIPMSYNGAEINALSPKLHMGYNPGYVDSGMANEFIDYNKVVSYGIYRGYLYRIGFNTDLTKFKISKKPLNDKFTFLTVLDNSDWVSNVYEREVVLGSALHGEKADIIFTGTEFQVVSIYRDTDIVIDNLIISLETNDFTQTRVTKVFTEVTAGFAPILDEDKTGGNRCYTGRCNSSSKELFITTVNAEGTKLKVAKIDYKTGVDSVFTEDTLALDIAVGASFNMFAMSETSVFLYVINNKVSTIHTVGAYGKTEIGSRQRSLYSNINNATENMPYSSFDIIYTGVYPWVLVKTNVDEELHLCLDTNYKAINFGFDYKGVDYKPLSCTLDIELSLLQS